MKFSSFKIRTISLSLITFIAISCINYQIWHDINQKKHFLEQLEARKNAIESNSDFLLYKSLNQEINIPKLTVIGKIPEWLQGTLFRIGPNKFETSNQTIKHIFDGFSMVHAFSINNGQVSYSNKFLQTNYYKNALKSGYITRGFDSDPCGSIFACAATIFSNLIISDYYDYDNANVNIIKLNENNFIAMTETPQAIKFDNNLNTIGSFSFSGDILGQVTTAHPHFDHHTNKLINYITNIGKNSTYSIYSTDIVTMHQKLIASVPVTNPSYMHSFGLTKNYIILTEIPLRLSPLKMLLSCKPFIENYEWNSKNNTIFTVINRNTGELVGRYETESFFMFHHINAFEEDNNIIIDLIAYKNPQIIKNFILDNKLLSKNHEKINFNPKRYRLNLANKSIQVSLLASINLEMPRINYERYNTKPYKFVYGISGWEIGDTEHSLIKLNVSNGSNINWSRPDCFPGEPIFIATPKNKLDSNLNSEIEDNGILLSVVLDTKNKNSFLLILDASTMREIARAQVPQNIPFCLHGNFYAN